MTDWTTIHWALALPEVLLSCAGMGDADVRRAVQARQLLHLQHAGGGRPAADRHAGAVRQQRHRLQRDVHQRCIQQLQQAADPGFVGARGDRVAGLRRARQHAAVRVPGPDAVQHRRNDADGVGIQPDDAVYRAGAAEPGDLRAGGVRPRRAALGGSRVEVFRARRVGLRPAAVRHLAGLRLLRHHGVRPAGGGAGGPGAGLARAGRRHRVHRRGPCLQGVRRAVPHVDAGRL